ncbi:MAG: hypothetical protein FJW23_01560 [Acidimicrobiia bacterium]|nr:hypothetical protein [Acidimicrobiia bacterium]
MTRRGARLVWILAASLAATACGLFGSDSSEAPSPVTLDGTYVGSINDSIAGAGTARITVVATGTSLSGTWQATFANASNNASGTLQGTFTDTTLTATFTPSVSGTCPWAVTMTRSGATMSGTYAATNCNVARAGSIDLKKQ